MADAVMESPRSIPTHRDLDRFIDTHGDERVRALTGPDRERLKAAVDFLNGKIERGHLMALEHSANSQRTFFARRFGKDAAPAPANAFTLKQAFEQAWKSAATRSNNTVVEVGRYVDEFIALNGLLDLREYTRDHWAAWRASCLEKHGAGPTAFKRFSMLKTICNEAIRAGLLERKNFAGQDVTMRKIKGKKLRNEGWSDEELQTWFGSDQFRDQDGKHADADYWVAVIIALTGARLSEVTGMQVPDVGVRHGVQTLYLAREHGKTEDSRRIIPIPRRAFDLGFAKYLESRPKKGPLFDGINPKIMSQTYARWRADIGITRKGADMHAFRHHLKTLLRNEDCPDVVNDYQTGHAADNVGATYGKTELQTALRFLNRIDLGVSIPKWKSE
jgi:integrase